MEGVRDQDSAVDVEAIECVNRAFREIHRSTTFIMQHVTRPSTWFPSGLLPGEQLASLKDEIRNSSAVRIEAG